MKQNRFRLLVANHWFFGLVIALFGLAACRVGAAESLYENDAVITNPSPTPDATNFLNTGSFSITFPSEALYETHDTLNYTNTGYMYSVFGFLFDTYSTVTSQDSEAADFDNENTIECGEQCIVWATNIVNPGWLDIDDGTVGLVQFTGNSVDLGYTTLVMEGGLSIGSIEVNGLDYGIGTDTKGEWQPSLQLTATTAESSYFSSELIPNLNNIMDLFDSTCYLNFDDTATNVTIIRAAFVQNENANTPYNVYFGAVSVGPGHTTIGWSGIYTNIATGQLVTNYLYLNDLPEPIITNGEKAVDDIPNNYTFTSSQTPLVTLAPAPAGYTDVFNTGTVTDNYSYVEAQFIATTTPTNFLIGTNVSAIGGRIEINAAQELNLSQSLIGGENYINLTSTNEFDDDGSAVISAPYADIDIGVTNGNLVVSNLLQSATPVWSGTIQAWSTRWLYSYTNTVGTNSFSATNDFRVELVNSDISPVTQSQVQNLTLVGTNSVVIADNLNVYGNLFINAQSLTLTTNGIGYGADSEEGTLIVENNNILWPGALPNLKWLTNNGAISIGNLAEFGSAASVYITNTTPSIPAVSPTSMLSGISNTTNGLAARSVTIGTNTYTFVNELTNTTPNQIKIVPTFDGTISNLIVTINHGAGSGTNYSSSTKTNLSVTAGELTNYAFTVTAITPGTLENSLPTTTTSTNLSWSSPVLSGGSNAVPGTTNIMSESGPYGAFVNNGSISDQGSQIYANYFENSGSFNNGENSFTLNSVTAVLTNGYIYAYYPFPPFYTNGYNGNISITANTLVASNVVIAAGGGLTLQVTNLLTDTGVTNGNTWYLDGGSSLSGLNLPIKPVAGDLLGTTIYVITPPPNKPVKNIWAGQDFGVSTSGYTNNEAIGQLILDVPTSGSLLSFAGVTNDNAIYVDRLVLEDYAGYANPNNQGNDTISTLSFNTNLTIYYADAVDSEFVTGGPLQDISYILNGANGGHLVWVPQYTGHFSSTNMVYPNGTTNTLNIGLATSPYLDSNGDGTPNDEDPEPIFEWNQIDFHHIRTNGMIELIWNSVPSATNYVLSVTLTNMAGPWWRTMNNWPVLTNFVSPSQIPPADGWPITNIVYEPILNSTNTFYRVKISQDTSVLYGQ